MNTKEKRWYLYRDRKQHGPFSDADLATFAELQQLQPGDLVWREGFSHWRAAATIFPGADDAPTPAGTRQEPAHSTSRMQPAASRAIPDERRPMLQTTYRGPTWKMTVIALACSALVGTASGYAFRVYVTSVLLRGAGQ
jgi:uncharacterized protein DUF4339